MWIKLCFTSKKTLGNIFLFNFKEFGSDLVFCLLEIYKGKENSPGGDEQALKATNVTKKHKGVVYSSFNFHHISVYPVMYREKFGRYLRYGMKIFSMHYLKCFIFNLSYAIHGHKEAIFSKKSCFFDDVLFIESFARESHPTEI